jgi:hypothetical protein
VNGPLARGPLAQALELIATAMQRQWKVVEFLDKAFAEAAGVQRTVNMVYSDMGSFSPATVRNMVVQLEAVEATLNTAKAMNKDITAQHASIRRAVHGGGTG